MTDHISAVSYLERDASVLSRDDQAAMTERLRHQMAAFRPWNEQEARDRDMMMALLDSPGVFTRENQAVHFTASAWICDAERRRVLMAFHKIYQSWAWTGGHADGERDLLQVALREAREETGIIASPLTEDIFSLEVLTVDGHEKRGQYVPSHLHLNITYLLEADKKQKIRIKADENAGVAWFSLEEALEKCSEPWMRQRIYTKLNEKLRAFAVEE